MKQNTKKVISSNNLPTRLPIFQTITCWLALDHWNAPGWLFGSLGMILLSIWIGSLRDLFTEEDVDVFKKNNDNENES